MTGPRGVSWHDLPLEQRERLRAINRKRRKMRELGIPAMVPKDVAVERIKLLHDQYAMTFKQIAEAVPESMDPLSPSTVSDLYRGRRSSGPIGEIPRRTQDRVLAVPIPALPLTSGANVDPTGTRRRLQALCCVGFGSRFVAEYLGHADWNFIWRITRGEKTSGHNCKAVFASTRDTIAELYEKLKDADPLDFPGSYPIGVGKTRAQARRNGYAPPHCWDEDTIDDPAAIPEWTGACGQAEGPAIHRRERIPMCPACRKARYTHPPAPKVELDREALERHIQAWDGTLRSLAAKLDMHVDSLSGWRNGQRSPSPAAMEKLAKVLGVHTQELIKK